MSVETDPPRAVWRLTIAMLLVWWLVCWWGTGYADLGYRRAYYAGAFGIVGSMLVLLAAAAVLYRWQRRVSLAALVEREQRVAHARDFLDQIVNTLVDPLFVKDHAHRWVLVNQAFCKIHGQPRENFIGKVARDVFPEAIAQRILEADELLLTAGIESVVEEKLTDSQGVTHVVVTKKAPYTDASGQRFIVGIISDISERKRVERLVRAREQEFRSLTDNLPDPVFRYDRDCRRVYVNPAAERVTAMTAAQLLGHVPTTCTTVTPEDATKTMAAIREVVATGERRSFHVGYIKGDGSVSDHQGLLVPEFDANGQVATVLTIAHDVTAMRRAERHTASFFANMPGFAYTLHLSPDGRQSLPFASSGIEDIYGLRPVDVRDDAWPMHALEHPEDLPRIAAAITQAVQTLQPFLAEFRVLRPGHPERWVESRSMPQRQADGGLLWHGVMLDITDRKHAEQRLTDALEFSNGVISAVPDTLLEVDREGRYLNVWTQNPHAQAALKAELLGKTIYDVLTPENAAIAMQAIVDADARGSSFGKAFCIERPNRDARWYEHSLAKKLSRGPSDVTFLVLSREVTNNIEAQQHLDETRKRLLGVLQTIPDMVWLKDVNGVYQLSNHAFSRLTGMAESNMLGRTDYDLFDAEQADFFRQQDLKAIEAGTTRLNEEWVNYADDGRRALLETRKVPVYAADGQLTGVLGIARDITERKEAELALRASEAHIQSRNVLLQAIVESSPEIIIFALDTTYRYLAFNRKHRETMQAIWGKDISIGMNMLDAIGSHPDRLVAQTSMERTLAGESFVQEETYGSELLSSQHWQTHWAPIRSESVEVVGLTCFVLNISERRTAEERLRKSRDIVRALAAHQETEREKERRKLAYEIHEDLAQNFAALRLNLAMLEMGSNSVAQAPVLKTMHGIADRSITRIRDMVSALRPAVLDLGLVSTLQWLVDDFRGVGLAFDLSLQDNIELREEVTTFLYRATKEALLNIALHAAATHVHVSLAATNGVCWLAVRDNGSGFDPAAPRGEGRFGLIGLAEGALHLGGEFFVDSTPGRGATLKIRMPIPHFPCT